MLRRPLPLQGIANWRLLAVWLFLGGAGFAWLGATLLRRSTHSAFDAAWLGLAGEGAFGFGLLMALAGVLLPLASLLRARRQPPMRPRPPLRLVGGRASKFKLD